MLRRTIRRLNDNIVNDTGSWRGKSLKNHLATVIDSPYKESFKDFWSTPVPWMPREYGPKPKPGDPIPLRDAANLIIAGKNNHIDPAIVRAGEDEDYKVLMLHKEGKGRYVKDQFTLPQGIVGIEDRNEDAYMPLFERLKVKDLPQDWSWRMTAIRASVGQCNILVIPPEGGQIAEVEGPPGGLKKWTNIIASHPEQIRNLIDILEIPYESALKSLLPYKRVHTPASETFRFDTLSYICTFGKLPCVQYTVSVTGHKLVWVSPTEALKRYNCGVMELPTQTAFLFGELKKDFPRFDMVQEKLKWNSVPEVVKPEIVHDEETRMATVLFPGDVHHTETEAARMDGAEGSEAPPALKRFHYMRDDPWGVRAVYFNRPVLEGDVLEPMTPAVHAKVKGDVGPDGEEIRMLEPISDEEHKIIEGTEAEKIAVRSRDILPSQKERKIPGMSLIDDVTRRELGLDRMPSEIEQKLAKEQHPPVPPPPPVPRVFN